jgi:TRAP-type C4-dicarboxylate transport system permease small subunit
LPWTDEKFFALERRHVTQSTDANEVLDNQDPIAPSGLGSLLVLVDAVAAILLAADLIVVSLSVFYRYVLAAPIEWADDVARGLMVAMAFFGAASALARNENAGVAFFVQKLGPQARRRVDAVAALVVLTAAGAVAWYAMRSVGSPRARRLAPACRSN